MRKKDEHSINTDCSVFSFWFDLSFIDYLDENQQNDSMMD